MVPSLVPAIITATVAFIAALIAQFLSHHFSRKREEIKEYKQVNQELIFPNLNDVILFIETETHFRKGHDVEETIDPNKIIKEFQSKISYGNTSLISALHRYRNSFAYFDGRGEGQNMRTFEVFFTYLGYAEESLKKSNIHDDYLLKLIKNNQKIYGISFLLADLIGKEKTFQLLSHRWLWSYDFLDRISTSLLEELIANYNNHSVDNHKLMCFINVIKEGFYESSDLEGMGYLKDLVEEMIESVKFKISQ
ncbi:hypothetical protein [Lysinibacillus fusiformis]|uniref:hypothetical protein n=1 Tax=Lysinibacillus fusiformis TaxID=28031 RepID=UPI00119D4DA5|nr:hypothetical protein [Lysinibacillus fusiformis]